MKKFPCGKYGFVALVFCWHEEHVLLCNICDRGWCIPSGRVEHEETSCQAVHREALEEAGAILHEPQYIGCYRMSERGEVRWGDVFVAQVKDLVEIGMPEESKGRKLVMFEELAEIYHLWTPLTEQVFLYSREVLARREKLGWSPCCSSFSLDDATQDSSELRKQS
jgi:8-oxo-dGTP diphosphatase